MRTHTPGAALVAAALLLLLPACDSTTGLTVDDLVGTFRLQSMTAEDLFGTGSGTMEADVPVTLIMDGIPVSITVSGTLTFDRAGTFDFELTIVSAITVDGTTTTQTGHVTESGTYTVQDDRATLTLDDEHADATLDGDRLTLTSPEGQTFVFVRD